MNKAELQLLAKTFNKVAAKAQAESDYDTLTVVTGILMDLCPALMAGHPRFKIDVFLRDVYGNDTAAASVKAAMDYLGLIGPTTESE